jgi:hypothetical protein
LVERREEGEGEGEKKKKKQGGKEARSKGAKE